MKNIYAILIITLFAAITFAQDSVVLEEAYNKKEYRIPMRDGVTLFTSVYSPIDTTVKYPILLWRTPYSSGPYGDGYSTYRRYTWQHLINEGYIIVFQDVRGRFMSEGKYENMRPYIKDKKAGEVDEVTDTYDTADWLVKNIPNNNGNIGLWGISYPGFYAALSAIDSHPAIKAVSPQAPIANWYGSDDFHHNGAFSIGAAFGFFYVFDIESDTLYKEWPQEFQFGTEDGYSFYKNLGPIKNANVKYFHNRHPFWNDVFIHPDYDAFWKERDTRDNFNNIKPAVLVVGGWFDAENLYGALETYKSIEKKNQNNNNRLVMGPWFHGGWVRSDGSSLGDIGFGSATGEYYIKNIELPFFNYYLKGVGQLELPEAYVFETGSNKWKKYNAWPPKNSIPKNIFLNENEKLSFDYPSESSGYDEFISDPLKPVPFTKEITIDVPKPYMVEDQRFAATRTDVLCYETEVLKDDLTIAGEIIADLFVSTSGTDTDWIVKLIDVFPDDSLSVDGIVYGGYQMMVRYEIMRGKYRNSLAKPEPFVPGEVTNVKFNLQDANHTFKKGHKIMVQIQSSMFPLFDMNPQTFTNIYQADTKDFRKATQRIYHTEKYPSKIVFQIIE